MHIPRKPTGSGPEAVFAQWVWEKLAHWLKFNDSSTVRWDRGPGGLTAHAKPQKGGGAAAPAVGLTTAYYLKSYANYWLCETVIGNGIHVRIAKPVQIQNNIAGETIYGTAFGYNYSHNNAADALYGIYRISTSENNVVEYQALIPQPQLHYQVKYISDVNTGLKVEHQDVLDNPTDGVTIATSIDFSDQTDSGFVWSKLADQSYGH